VAIERELPSALSDDQREALSQFLAGHISAGQFSERLAVSARDSEVAAPSPAPSEPASGAL
jgi:hypothetical protein